MTIPKLITGENDNKAIMVVASTCNDIIIALREADEEITRLKTIIKASHSQPPVVLTEEIKKL